MSVEIKDLGSNRLEVNGKLVYLDHDGNWKSMEELSSREYREVYSYINNKLYDLENRKN